MIHSITAGIAGLETALGLIAELLSITALFTALNFLSNLIRFTYKAGRTTGYIWFTFVVPAILWLADGISYINSLIDWRFVADTVVDCLKVHRQPPGCCLPDHQASRHQSAPCFAEGNFGRRVCARLLGLLHSRSSFFSSERSKARLIASSLPGGSNEGSSMKRRSQQSISEPVLDIHVRLIPAHGVLVSQPAVSRVFGDDTAQPRGAHDRDAFINHHLRPALLHHH